MNRVKNSLAAVFVASVLGCSDGQSGLVPVKGRITFDGEAVPAGRITFHPKEGGRHSSGKILSDGSYHISTYTRGDGIPPGDYVVSIKAVGVTQDANERVTGMQWYVPEPYSDAARSPLSATIKADVTYDQLDFPITSTGKP